jgi:hypothetical protein
MHINKDGIRILDYVSVLGNPRTLSPEEKAKLDDAYKRMQEIVSAHKVTIICPRSISREGID